MFDFSSPSRLEVRNIARKKQGFGEANTLLKKLPSKKKEASDKKKLLDYLSAEYGLTYYNKSFIYKLQHINDGTLQNLQVPITYETLLDMFEYYKQYIKKQQQYNKKIGKIFTEQQGALSYDLAILLSKHADYLTAREKEKANSADDIQITSTMKLVENIVEQPKSDETEIDINQMIEDW